LRLDALFNKPDYAAAERYWSPHYIQHSAHIEPGREGLFNLIRSLPPTLKYEPGTIVADADLVMVHGRFSAFGCPLTGLRRTFSASRTAFLPSTGM
jgi:predicted SnoaL-like aldol condensation-catalyzing enzyme